jgi:DNA-binding NarL/FixJ family response regulator
MKVIVVDDDEDTVEVFSEFLELKDIQVVGRAHDGKQAVDLYEKLKPDIMLMDVMMPVYDGFYAIEKIRKMNPDAKIIMVTADLSLKTKQKLRELNVSGVIFKPYNIDRVLDIIHSIENGETVFLSL